jgi:hypothetical protein
VTFDPLTAPQDYFVLAGQKSPGLAEIIGAESARSFAVHQPPFATGARIVFKRRELAKFSAKIRLVTSEDFAAWDAWRPLVDAVPDVRREAKALDIQHPLLVDLDIKRVVVESVSQLEQIEDGVWQVTIKFLESKGLPKVTLAKVEGSKATPADPVDTLIDQLAGQAQELSR